MISISPVSRHLGVLRASQPRLTATSTMSFALPRPATGLASECTTWLGSGFADCGRTNIFDAKRVTTGRLEKVLT